MSKNERSFEHGVNYNIDCPLCDSLMQIGKGKDFFENDGEWVCDGCKHEFLGLHSTYHCDKRKFHHTKSTYDLCKLQCARKAYQENVIEKIVDHDCEDGEIVFRVRWKGYGPDHDEWLYYDEFDNHVKLINEYLKKNVTEIVDHGICGGMQQYYVRWEGSDNPEWWADYEFICPDIVKMYIKDKIKKIVHCRNTNDGKQYQIQWKDPKKNSWWVEEQLVNDLPQLNTYVNKSKKNKKARKLKIKSRNNKKTEEDTGGGSGSSSDNSSDNSKRQGSNNENSEPVLNVSNSAGAGSKRGFESDINSATTIPPKKRQKMNAQP